MEKEEARSADVWCAGIQRSTDYGAIISFITLPKCWWNKDMQTLNDDILKKYEPVSPEINEIAAGAIISGGWLGKWKPAD